METEELTDTQAIEKLKELKPVVVGRHNAVRIYMDTEGNVLIEVSTWRDGGDIVQLLINSEMHPGRSRITLSSNEEIRAFCENGKLKWQIEDTKPESHHFSEYD